MQDVLRNNSEINKFNENDVPTASLSRTSYQSTVSVNPCSMCKSSRFDKATFPLLNTARSLIWRTWLDPPWKSSRELSRAVVSNVWYLLLTSFVCLLPLLYYYYVTYYHLKWNVSLCKDEQWNFFFRYLNDFPRPLSDSSTFVYRLNVNVLYRLFLFYLHVTEPNVIDPTPEQAGFRTDKASSAKFLRLSQYIELRGTKNH